MDTRVVALPEDYIYCTLCKRKVYAEKEEIDYVVNYAVHPFFVVCALCRKKEKGLKGP